MAALLRELISQVDEGDTEGVTKTAAADVQGMWALASVEAFRQGVHQALKCVQSLAQALRMVQSLLTQEFEGDRQALGVSNSCVKS